MVVFDEKRLNSLIDSFKNKTVLILGDLMLDEYLIGTVKRISPEAPVPVVDIMKEQVRFGGAANVALNILKLGCNPLLMGVIGSDREGERFRDLMRENGMSEDGLVALENRPTTLKTRVIGEMQHITRIDRESKSYLSESDEEVLIDAVQERISEAVSRR